MQGHDFVFSHRPSTSFSFKRSLIPTFDAIMPDKLTASLNKLEINYNDHKTISTGNVEPTIYAKLKKKYFV